MTTSTLTSREPVTRRGWGHLALGEIGEKVVTVLGGILMTGAHWRNSRLCHSMNCHERQVGETGQQVER